ESVLRKPGVSPEDALTIFIEYVLDDIGSERTTHLFTELWAMANHSEFIAARLETLYRYIHNVIGEFVSQLNSALSPDEVRAVALFISASMEGMTMFCGFKKPWEARMPEIKALAVKS